MARTTEQQQGWQRQDKNKCRAKRRVFIFIRNENVWAGNEYAPGEVHTHHPLEPMREEEKSVCSVFHRRRTAIGSLYSCERTCGRHLLHQMGHTRTNTQHDTLQIKPGHTTQTQQHRDHLFQMCVKVFSWLKNDFCTNEKGRMDGIVIACFPACTCYFFLPHSTPKFSLYNYFDILYKSDRSN